MTRRKDLINLFYIEKSIDGEKSNIIVAPRGFQAEGRLSVLNRYLKKKQGQR